VFQDPYSSLNPTMTVGQSLAEVLKVHRVVNRRGRADRVAELLSTVGLAPAQADRRPVAFSGGERQRIGIARALAVQPEVIIADEPLHPYTQALVRAAPRLTTKRKAAKAVLGGELPNAIDRPPGCHFHPRCPMVMPRCREEEPLPIRLPGGRTVACHLHGPPSPESAAGRAAAPAS
jgi:oligopeptide/dipeptide ABC transporter ATP-binding protein